MVRIADPPPTRLPDPLIATLPAGATLVRVFDPTRHGAGPTTFRSVGPLHRFDPHEPDSHGDPQVSPTGRGIAYIGLALSCCVVEVFGDTGVIEPGTCQAAELRTLRPLTILDLRRPGAMRAGTVAALAKTADRRCSQLWGRYFYEHPELYGEVDGLWYFNAHNDEEALALFERAASALVCEAGATVPLADPTLRPLLLDIARANHLVLL